MRRKVEQISTTIVVVNARTRWLFVHVETHEGIRGTGEATLDPPFEMGVAGVQQAASRVVDKSFDSPNELFGELVSSELRGGLVEWAGQSAIEQALWDIVGRDLGLPVHQLFGGKRRDHVGAYANLNPGLMGDRSPAAFAAAAAAAVTGGFTAIKCAPFDGLERHPNSRTSASLLEAGLERVQAVREAVGSEIALMVDCHQRFDARTAARSIEKLSEFAPYWIEEPVSPHSLEAWSAVRSATDARLAGGETLSGLVAFRDFISRSGVDVVMPDVKYCGGLESLRKISAVAEAEGVVVSPHGPDGPVSSLATVHVVATLPNIEMVEYAWRDSEWRSDLVSGAETLDQGRLVVPDTPGFGGEFDFDVAAAHSHPKSLD